MTTAVFRGFRDARQALGTALAAVIALASWCCVLLAGLLERPSAVSGRSEPSLLEAATFGVVLPLASYALCSRLGSSRDELMNAHWARHGASRRLYALGRMAYAALLGVAITISSAVLAFGLSRVVLAPPPAVGVTSAFVGVIGVAALGAASYAACFALAQLLAGRWGRGLFLFADWALGSGAGVAALPWPRAHLRALLGGPAVLDMGTAQTAQFLICLALVAALTYARRIPP